MPKKYLLVSLIIISIMLMFSSFDGASKTINSSGTIQGKIIFKSGTVLVNGKSIIIGHILKYGDKIETKKNSSCTFTVGQKKIFKLRADTKVTFKISKSTGAIELNKGWLAGVMKGKKLWKKKFSINTPLVTAGIRGTSFALKVENNKSVYFCTCNGIISFIDKNHAHEHEVSNAHHGAEIFIKQKDGSIKIAKFGLKYHDDNTIEELAEEINEEIDWSTVAK